MPDRRLLSGRGSLEELVEAGRREEAARGRFLRDFDLGELMLRVRSRDSFGKARVRRCLPARGDDELLELTVRLLEEARRRYNDMHALWQRQLVGYLTSLGAEAAARLDGRELTVPPGFDYVGLEAAGSPGRRISLRTEQAGYRCGERACCLDLRAGQLGDHCFSHSRDCRLTAGRAGDFLGERSEAMRLEVGEAGDWLLLKSRGARARLRRTGRLAGLDSHDLELQVDFASYELGARAHNASIFVHREVLTMGLSGSGVVYLAPGVKEVRTCFEVRRLQEGDKGRQR